MVYGDENRTIADSCHHSKKDVWMALAKLGLTDPQLAAGSREKVPTGPHAALWVRNLRM